MLSDDFEMKYFLVLKGPEFFSIGLETKLNKEILLGHILVGLHCIFAENKHKLVTANITVEYTKRVY